MFEKARLRRAENELSAAEKRRKDTEENGRATRAAFHGTAAGRGAVESSGRADKDAKKNLEQAQRKVNRAAQRLNAKNARNGR